ncbi:MAG: ClbS/DfsB family four-helix bundle protein, partial [Anaerolineales bacterium]|nr:ClbS/DfsB family four-helix bundle protein [Anaerolineales bacterium]
SIRVERKTLEETIARLSESQMRVPGASGEWTVKDVLAHISAWEGWMVRWTDMHLRGEAPDVPLPWDVERMNAGTYARHKDKPLPAVMEEFHVSYRDALALVHSLSEEQLQTENTDTWPMGPLWTGVAANTHWHYKEHRESIEAWLQQSR